MVPEQKVYDGYALRTNCHIMFEDNRFVLTSTNETILPVVINPMIAYEIDLLNAGHSISQVIEILQRIGYGDKEYIRCKIISMLEIVESFMYVRTPFDVPEEVPIDRYLEAYKLSAEPYNIKREQAPRQLSFLLTNDCERRCIYCFRDAKYFPTNQSCKVELPITRFKQLISEARQLQCNFIDISGGDPFVCDNIEDYLQTVIASEIPFNISTKQYISKTRATQLAAIGLKKIQISIDSHIPTLADRMMGVKGSYDQLIQTIKNLQTCGIDIRLKSVIISENIETIVDTFTFFSEKMGVTEFSPNIYTASCGRHKEELYPSIEQLNDFEKQMKNFIPNLRKRGVIIEYIDGYAAYVAKKKLSSQAYKDVYRGVCGACTYSLIINPSGKVSYCSYLSDHPDFFIGSILDSSIQDVWNSRRIDEIKNMPKNNFRNTKCFDCTSFHSCLRKRCYLRSILYSGTPYDIDPWCKYGDPLFTDCVY